MTTSRVKTNLFLTFEIAAKWQNVCYTQRSYRPISLNQPIRVAQLSKFFIFGMYGSKGITYNTRSKFQRH